MANRKYSVILGNLGNTCDRFCSGYKENPKTLDMLDQAVNIPEVKGVELVGTWDIHEKNVQQMKTAFIDHDIVCVSIIPDLFANKLYGNGSYTSRDAKIRQHAIDYTRRLCDIAMEMNCKTINIWPGQDGYDYLLTSNYMKAREHLCDAVVTLAKEYPNLDFAMEYKPKEPRTHSYVARMADSLLLALETECSNVGVTIDTGHAFNAGEVVAESIVLAKRYGDKLMHMHFNDNYTSWDDDMIVGSVHTTCYLEILYWLDECGYDGWLSMDQYPYREDAASAISESIQWLMAFDRMMDTNRDKIRTVIEKGSAVEVSSLMRSIIAG